MELLKSTPFLPSLPSPLPLSIPPLGMSVPNFGFSIPRLGIEKPRLGIKLSFNCSVFLYIYFGLLNIKSGDF